MENDPQKAATEIAARMRGRRTLAITGAGVSTDSGLPDYRGTGGSGEPTVDFQMFTADPMWQRWVWQCNHETWKHFEKIEPSAGHQALADLEARGYITGIATQNIDGLHTKAGSRRVWELHGSFREVVCIDCGHRISRREYAIQLEHLNPGWPEYDEATILAPVNHDAAAASTFRVAPCSTCGGLLKPAVVMFGEALPNSMDDAMAAARDCDVALVVGTSLLVSTGAWIVRQAWANGAETIIINRGPTAEDNLANYRTHSGASEVLTRVADLLA